MSKRKRKSKLNKAYSTLLKDCEDYFNLLCNKLQKQYGNAFILKVNVGINCIVLWYYDIDDDCYDLYKVLNIDMFGNILLLNEAKQEERDTRIESHSLPNKLRLINLIEEYLKYGK